MLNIINSFFTDDLCKIYVAENIMLIHVNYCYANNSITYLQSHSKTDVWFRI